MYIGVILGSLSFPSYNLSEFKVNLLKKSIEIPHFKRNILPPLLPDSVIIVG